MYGVWQTGRHYSTPGLQPWAVSETLSKLEYWAEVNIPAAEAKRLFFAEKIGNQSNLTDAAWIVTGMLYKDGIKVTRKDPEIYTKVRSGNGKWSHPDSYPEVTEIDWQRLTVNVDADQEQPDTTEAVEQSRVNHPGVEATPLAVIVEEIPTAAVNTEYSEMNKLISEPVVYAEAQLSQRFERYLRGHQRKVIRYRITYPGSAPLYSDLADATANVLYEAKGSATRISVRLAIGEVLDYGRQVPDVLMAILLPEAPSGDLICLLKDHDIGCVVETGRNFTDLTGLNRCP